MTVITDNYKSIHKRKGLFYVQKSKVERLKLSILKHGYNLGNPIIVNHELTISDGNHRWTALNELREEGKTFKYSYKIK